MTLTRILLLTAFIASAPLSPSLAATVISGRAEVSDGDTLRLGPIRLRLHGIDAPEIGQSCARPGGGSWDCGEAASRHLETLVAGRELRCEDMGRDRYDRVIARCEAGGRDLGAAMVESGMAWAYSRYSGDYLAQEARARGEGAGIWAAATEPAWEYRAARWAAATGVAPREDCPIKGNISKSGERIYHMPWSPAYARTVITEAKGERWFCNEAEAEAAGWRAAR